MRRARIAFVAGASALAALVLPAPAQARPQITSGATTGAAMTDLRAENGPRLAYHLGARLEILLLRVAPRDMAIGPYLDVATAAFDTFEGGGGFAWLVPTGSTGFVFSVGGFARTSSFGWEPGAAGTIFWGSRSYNYHSSYAIGAGLFVQGRYGLRGEGQQADAILGAQIDLEYLALPWVLAYEAITR